MEKNIYIKKNISKKNIAEKGSYTIEAAIIIPLVIVAVLTLAHVIYASFLVENIAYISTDENKNLAIESYDKKYIIGYSENIENRIKEENEKIIDINVSNMGYLYYRDGNNGIISYEINYSSSVNLPLGFIDSYSDNDRYMFRGYIGKSNKWNPATFSKMEKKDEAVWIFPESGKKYHKESCTYVTTNYKRGILLDSTINNFESCDICASRYAQRGNIIFYFPKHGEKYHLEGCASVTKYTTVIDREQAKNRGYTACLKCGG